MTVASLQYIISPAYTKAKRTLLPEICVNPKILVPGTNKKKACIQPPRCRIWHFIGIVRQVRGAVWKSITICQFLASCKWKWRPMIFFSPRLLRSDTNWVRAGDSKRLSQIGRCNQSSVPRLHCQEGKEGRRRPNIQREKNEWHQPAKGEETPHWRPLIRD